MNDPYGLGNSNPGNSTPGNGYGGGGYAPPPSAPLGQPDYGHQSYGQGYAPPPNHTPGYGPGQAPYGAPQAGPQGYVSYGQGAAPPNIYTPTSALPNNEMRQLEDDAQLWLMVAAAGFWFGFGWVTGPLAWYYGSQIRGKYRALGHHPCSSANWARGLGIASTLIYFCGVALVVMAVVLAVTGAVLL